MFIHTNKKQEDTKQNSGFAVLFSVMLASFLITLGISIFSISLKEIQITTSVRDSQVAYYAADSARECALYWDIKEGIFPACFNNDCSLSTPYVKAPICNGVEITELEFHQVNTSPEYITGPVGGPQVFADFFKFPGTESAPASDIRITKAWDESSQSVVTTIETWGHNTQILGRRVERGIRLQSNL